ncbi:MAG: Gfo/Idh/MocA family oxidoreductase [Anaerolineae bacterium]|nr:Gfo/Idh/MocA family oxidoreductase [Anaerolineae bacterium]
MGTIRWGIIGVGNVTEVKSGPGFLKARDSALVAVMRRSAHLAEDYARRHGVARWYDDAQALIDDPDVDAVYVATPPDSHKTYALMAAAAGKPVYVEKPMALNFAECAVMIEACRSAGVPLFVAYYRRMLPRFLKVKELLAEGAIGEVHSVQIVLHRRVQPASDDGSLPWRVRPEISGGGHFVDLGAHIFDFLDDALGPVRRVQGIATNAGGQYPAEDNVVTSFEFESGVVGSGSFCFSTFYERDCMELIGTRGKVAFSAFDETPILLTTAEGSIEFPIANPSHVQQPLIQTIVDELNGIGQCPSTGVSASRTTQVIDQILAGYRASALSNGALT